MKNNIYIYISAFLTIFQLIGLPSEYFYKSGTQANPYAKKMLNPYDNKIIEIKSLAKISYGQGCSTPPVLSTPEDIKKYTFPNETLVDMNEFNSITVRPGDPKKTISTFGLCGCLALVFYARQNGIQSAYLSHDDAIALEQKIGFRVRQVINDMHKTTPQPEVIDVFIVSPGGYENYELVPQPEHRDLNRELSLMLSQEFPKAQISAHFAPYSAVLCGTSLKFYGGGRSIIAELNPDYTKIKFFT